MAEEREQNKPANNIESLKKESVSASEKGNGRMTFDHFTGLLEAGIFIAEEPITLDQLSRLSREKPSKVKEKIDLLMNITANFHGASGLWRPLVDTASRRTLRMPPPLKSITEPGRLLN